MNGRVSNEEESGTAEDDYVLRLKDNSLLSEAISGLQKAIRRNMEAEALVLALGLYDSNYGMALAKRIPVVATEDISLADPAAVAQACTLCMMWITLKKEAGKDRNPDCLPLMMAVMLLCRADKSREVDNACVVIREEQKRGTGDHPMDVIERYHDLIVDSHTAAGSAKLRRMAAERGLSYEQIAWEDFYQNGAVLQPLKEINGDPWSHRAYALFGMEYDAIKSGKKSESSTEPDDMRCGEPYGDREVS
jgi:hypothetical protein